MNRASIPGVAGLYVSLLPTIIEIGKLCGYAIGVHGTASHDFDLIAVPWVHNAIPASDFINRIKEHFGGYIEQGGVTVRSQCPERKVHGRVAWSIYFNSSFTGPYIDISVMPRIDYETNKIIEDVNVK
jgi:hypothetical protein